MTVSSKPVIAVIRGQASFAKILGKPVPNYAKDGLEWKMDLVLSPAGKKEVVALGIKDRIKQKDTYLEGTPYMSIKQAELRKNGDNNDPITVVDIAGNPWDPNKLIGNGSDVEVKFSVVDNGPGKFTGVYIRSVRVLKLIPYSRQEFDEISEDDEFFAEYAAAKAVEKDELDKVLDITRKPELDDDIPV